MNRLQFLKVCSSIISTSTLTSSLVSSFFFKEEEGAIIEKILIDTQNDKLWLAELVKKYLIKGLGAKTCDCDTLPLYQNYACCHSCQSYSEKFTEKIYEYKDIVRFTIQKHYEKDIVFTNISVPFLTIENTHIINVEGPFLAGLCFLAKNIKAKYGNIAQEMILPIQETNNGGGFFFFNKSCRSTQFKTMRGVVTISWTTIINTEGLLNFDYKSDNINYSDSISLKFI